MSETDVRATTLAPAGSVHRRNPLTSTPLGGRLLSASQLPWFTLLPPRGFGVLTTVGRSTGKRRRRCVRVIRVGTTAYLTSIRGPAASWYRNLIVQPTVRLRLRGGTFEGSARTLRPDEVAAARTAYCDTVNPFDRLEYLMHLRGRPARDRIKALHRHWFDAGAPIAVDLDGGTDARS